MKNKVLANTTISTVTPKVPSRLYPRLVRPYSFNHPLLDAFEQAEYGELLLSAPDGQAFTFVGSNSGPQAELYLRSWQPLDALLARGEVGFAEAYIAGLWKTNDLSKLLTWALVNADALERYFYGHPLHALWMRIKAMRNANSLSGSRRNILKHYDLGNEFYELWLDKSMTYSSAIFGKNHDLTLEEAQQAKYYRILDRLGAKSGDHILEIGCGWGGFAETAARKGIRVTGVTISEAQKKYADERLLGAGLNNIARLELTDYRQIDGQFDYIVSIGMFEHVGKKYWSTYFNTIRKRLKPSGKAIVQTITLDDDVFERANGKHGFIEEYIFPGGFLPSKRRFREAAESKGLEVNDIFAFGQDYALTLSHWLKRFEAARSDVLRLGYDEFFIRMWRFYLSCCIAAFTSKRTDVMQAELRRK